MKSIVVSGNETTKINIGQCDKDYNLKIQSYDSRLSELNRSVIKMNEREVLNFVQNINLYML